MKSPIKWSGSKLKLADTLQNLMPPKYNIYYEPFVGSGALLLNVLPKVAVINDINPFIAKMFQVIKDDDEYIELIDLLKTHKKNNSKDYYLSIRMQDRTGELEKLTDVQQVARFMYMNKVAFNGLWRVNSKGQNNVPYGKYKNPDIVAEERIVKVHEYLSNNEIQIENTGFEEATGKVKEGDFVYFDPPYVPLNQTSNFTSYSKNGFGIVEQKKLRDLFFELDKRGAFVMLSNSTADLVYKLYDKKGIAKFHTVETKRVISAKASSRGTINELVITNY